MRRSPEQREADLTRISELYLKGWKQWDIGQAIGLSQPQVSNELRRLHQIWREEQADNINDAKIAELERIGQLEREYWAAWQRSCGIAESRTLEKYLSSSTGTVQDPNQLVRETVNSRLQTGDPRYLEGVRWCIAQRIELFGLRAPQTFWFSGPNGEPIKTERVEQKLTPGFFAEVVVELAKLSPGGSRTSSNASVAEQVHPAQADDKASDLLNSDEA